MKSLHNSQRRQYPKLYKKAVKISSYFKLTCTLEKHKTKNKYPLCPRSILVNVYYLSLFMAIYETFWKRKAILFHRILLFSMLLAPKLSFNSNEILHTYTFNLNFQFHLFLWFNFSFCFKGTKCFLGICNKEFSKYFILSCLV